MTRISSARRGEAVLTLVLAVSLVGSCQRGKICDPGYQQEKAGPQGVWCRKADVAEAIYFQLYADGGQRRERCRFISGKPEGPFLGWHPGGQRWIEGQYANGRLDGVWSQWDVGGNKVAGGEYRDGKLVSGAPVGMGATCASVHP